MALSVSLFKQRAIVHLWKGYIEFGDYPNGYLLVRSKETTDAYKEIGTERGYFTDGSLNQDFGHFCRVRSHVCWLAYVAYEVRRQASC